MSDIDQYDYELPKHLIAQQPTLSRVDARLLLVDRRRKSLEHKHIRDLPEILRPDDCLVLNETKVVPARLVGYRTQTGGRWEGLFLEAQREGFWLVLGHTRGKLTPGESITLVDRKGRDEVELALISKEDGGNWIVKPSSSEDAHRLLERVGRVPRAPGSVAAPTAGLHFSEALVESLEKQGVAVVFVTLHVGLGTFRPISADTLNEHKMHSEWGTIGTEAVGKIEYSRQRGGRIVGVGTTVVRLLETAAAGGNLRPFSGQTDLFIRPPYVFRAADCILTNFHLPRTTLLVLVRTFGGDELIQKAYHEAIREQYRFYSYGDAMMVL